MRGSIHPQGVGRWVPGGFAATHSHAALHQRYAIRYLASQMRIVSAVLEIRGCEATNF